MKNVKLTVAYDGTNYHGWQLQPNGISIEEVLNNKLTELLGEEIVVTGASRTDAGVHSLGNVAVFKTNHRMPAEKISYALNQRLPDDIVVVDSCEVAMDFHPRHCDSKKTYEYRILNREFPDPTRRYDTYFCYRKLNLEAMQKAASYLVGKRDFTSFCSSHAEAGKSKVRFLYSCSVKREDDIIKIRVTGSGFLYNMVRIIAGTLIQVGCGEIAPEQMPIIIARRDRNYAGPTAPANGLTMIGIEFL